MFLCVLIWIQFSRLNQHLFIEKILCKVNYSSIELPHLNKIYSEDIIWHLTFNEHCVIFVDPHLRKQLCDYRYATYNNSNNTKPVTIVEPQYCLVLICDTRFVKLWKEYFYTFMYCISKVDLIVIIQLKMYYLFSKDSKKNGGNHRTCQNMTCIKFFQIPFCQEQQHKIWLFHQSATVLTNDRDVSGTHAFSVLIGCHACV